MITHNRATIEVADTIYGVTMTDAAVSRVLSLRLADLPVEVTADVPPPARGAGHAPGPRARAAAGNGRPPAARRVRHGGDGPAREAVRPGSAARSILGGSSAASEATWDEVEEALIAADVGAETTLDIVDAARARLGAVPRHR